MQYNDYELISLAREGNEEAINLIYQKYKPIIVSKSTDAIVTASHHGIEISDIMQEGFIGLDEAINGFSEKDNASFYTFAVLCINRQIINYLRKTTRGRDRILNDAVTIPGVDENIIQVPIIKGDAKSVSIAAASIVAKVTRDRMMVEYAKEYPEYGFEKNKGYGSKEHIDAIKKVGPCEIHRRSFIKNFMN